MPELGWGTLGMGKARIIVEMTRPDGTIDRMEVFKMNISDTDNARFKMIDLNQEVDILHDLLAVKPPDWYMKLEMEGRLFQRSEKDDGILYETRSPVTERVITDG